jgi:integrase/recombinase XerD
MLALFNSFTSKTTVEEVNVTHVYNLINALKDSGVKPTSINHYLRDCRAFLYWCMDEERSYMKRFKVSLVEAQEEQVKLFTDDELERLLEKPNKNDSFLTWRTWVIVNWVLATGNRASTICDIRVGDIDFTSKEISLRHTKNKRSQIIPLSPSLEITLKEYIKMWRYDAPEDGWLFPNVCEDKLTTNAQRHSFAKYCKDREVSRTNIHGLRHNFAKGWVRNNGNMFVLQKILGHSTLEMTKKYVRLFSEDIKEDFEKFSPLDTIKRSSKRTQIVKRKF